MRDDQARVTAEFLNRRLTGWYVFWERYRRRFTAIAMCTPTATAIDAPDARTLIEGVEAVQRAAFLTAQHARRLKAGP
jgi:hypothetical protein